MNYADFIELVVRHDVRPERPEPVDAPRMTDAIWELAEQCWVKDPAARPSANGVCGAVAQLLEAEEGEERTEMQLPAKLPSLSPKLGPPMRRTSDEEQRAVARRPGLPLPVPPHVPSPRPRPAIIPEEPHSMVLDWALSLPSAASETARQLPLPPGPSHSPPVPPRQFTYADDSPETSTSSSQGDRYFPHDHQSRKGRQAEHVEKQLSMLMSGRDSIRDVGLSSGTTASRSKTSFSSSSRTDDSASNYYIFAHSGQAVRHTVRQCCFYIPIYL